PGFALTKLAATLKPDAILELMVYNRYHRIPTSVFQKAIRLLNGKTGATDFETDLQMAKRLLAGLPDASLIRAYLGNILNEEEAAIADALVNPVEHSYTVESLEELATSCGLEILTHTISQYDRVTGGYTWNMEFKDPLLQR